MKIKKLSKGQSLVELLVAIGIFVIVIAGLIFLVLDSYITGRLASEITVANFLTEEGIEAVRSIRDNNFADLTAGSHGLVISGGHWIFQGTSEDISGELRAGTRIITIEDAGIDRKKITSQINWQFSEGRTEEVKLVTYLTNWQKVSVGLCTGTCTPCDNFGNRTACNAQAGCRWIARFRICSGTCTPCGTFLNQTSCESQSGCSWVWQ